VAISDPVIKQRIRLAAEAEERRSYTGGRMPPAGRSGTPGNKTTRGYTSLASVTFRVT